MTYDPFFHIIKTLKNRALHMILKYVQNPFAATIQYFT